MQNEITMKKLFINKKFFYQSVLSALLISLFSNGCFVVGPDYTRVKPDTPKAWNTTLSGGLTDTQMAPDTLSRWWTILGDPQLESLEKRAVQGNLELENARARIREGRELRGISQAKLFPSTDATGTITDHRSSENNGLGHEGKLYAAGFDAGWELDIFGGTQRAIEAAQAEVESSVEDLHDVLVSLLAEVALNYVDVRTYQNRLKAMKENIAVQQETYELNLSLSRAGLIDELALEQSLYNLEHSRSQIPGLQTGLEAAKNRLAVLLGKKPGAVHPELAEKKSIPAIPLSLAIGIPAETLRHRPDIRRAERNLAAATARIGVATADLYPKFRLSGTIGLESISSGNLWQWASRSWDFGPGVSWNIFDAGAIRRNIEVQNARQEQALINYESTVLQAQEEVENALVAYAKEQQRRSALAKATAAAKRADLLARDQYQAGLVDFNDVLDAQRSLLSFQDELAQSSGVVTTNLIRLYKALGGGWTAFDPTTVTKQKTGLKKGKL